MARTSCKGLTPVVCGACGTKTFVFRKGASTRKVGHPKAVHCITCGTKTKHVEHSITDKTELSWAVDKNYDREEMERVTRLYSFKHRRLLGYEGQKTVAELMYADRESYTGTELEEKAQEMGLRLHYLKDFRN